jgi:hypothetical protein
MADDRDRTTAAADEARFVQLVAMFQMAAMQHLGKLPSPATNAVERDLEQARATIEMLEVLHRKTQGNRTRAEDAWFDKVLFELRMNYVDEVRSDESKARAGETEKGAADTAGTREKPEGPDGDATRADG